MSENKNTNTLIILLAEKIQQRERDREYITALKEEIRSLRKMVTDLATPNTSDTLSEVTGDGHLQCETPTVDMSISKSDSNPPTYHDWVTIGRKLIQEHGVSDNTKRGYICCWEHVVGPIRTNSDISNLYEHVTKHLLSLTHESTRLTRWGQLVGILKSCKVDPTWEEAVKDAQSPQCKFNIGWAKLRNSRRIKDDYKESDCEKLICPDGRYFTTERAQALCDVRLSADLTHKSAYQTLVLSLFAFHGNRPQDWCGVRLHKEQLGENESFLNTETRELHLYAGKTQKEGTVRVVEVHPKVVLALKNYRDGLSRVCKETPWVVPTQEDPSASANADGLRKCLQNALWGKKTTTAVKLTVPEKKLTLQDFRHLYEAHIRYSPSKLTTQEIDARMKEIGHSPSTALRIYSELYKKIYAMDNGPRCEPNSQVEIKAEAEEAHESKEEGIGATACSEAEHRNRTEDEQDEQDQHDHQIQIPTTE